MPPSAGLAAHAEAFCRRARDGLAGADFDQERALLELLADRVVVANNDAETRYVVPTGPDGEREPFCRLRSDYRNDNGSLRGADQTASASHGFLAQQTEAAIGVAVLNRMLTAGRPKPVRVQRVIA